MISPEEHGVTTQVMPEQEDETEALQATCGVPEVRSASTPDSGKNVISPTLPL